MTETPRRLRLLLVIGSLGGGGAERQVVNLLATLDRTRYEPLLYLVYRTGALLGEVPADVPVISFDRHPPRTGWRRLVGRLPGQLRRDIIADLTTVLRDERIDCVYDRTYHMTLLAAPAASRAGVPRLSTVASDPKSDFDQQERRYRWLKRRLLTRAYRTADRVIAVSEGVRQGILAEYRPAPERVVTLYNPVDFERIATLAREPLPEPMRAVFDAPSTTHLVAAGRLQIEKRFDLLIAAFGMLAGEGGVSDGRSTLHLHLLGEGPLRPELTRQVESLGLSGRVHLWGFQPNPFPVFARAELFVLSSHHEGFPGVLVEALAAGARGLVSTDCPHGPREILDGEQGGWLVPRDDAAALTTGLRAALSDPVERDQRTARCRERVRALCSRPATLARLETLIKEVTREHGRKM